ncbi:hypothetical protein DL546_004147 [Coniochaeta pulveracea]|uniref:Uncharacterized protein n=1 Tax=Coniochaeta pulveracea TaxID=177199 RepID=A0A420YFQ6_9PEZI|nr:hypothetical protein DL546_004147 [Coniochaeta pulveracea]
MSTQQPRRHKRKRSASAISTSSPSSRAPSHLPPDAINPLSHPPNLLKQYRLAGLSEDQHLPSIPDFPHRPLPRSGSAYYEYEQEPEDTAGETEADFQTETEVEVSARKQAERRARGARRERRAREQNVGALVGILRRCVEAGDTVRAKRAFGLLVRADIYGKRVDLRSEGYWGLGGEILMTQGQHRQQDMMLGGDEFEDHGDGEAGRGERRKETRRWGSAANMVNLTRYFEELIQLHPYSRLHPNSLSAQDFYPVLFNAEIYNIYSEFEMALDGLEEEDFEEEFGAGMDVDLEDEMDRNWDRPLSGREERLKATKDRLRLNALEGARQVAGRMDELMQNLPYSKSLEMMRLRGVIALFMGDLAVPCPPRSDDEEYDGRTRRDRERDRAVKLFQKVEAQGGQLDPWLRQVMTEVSSADEEDEDAAMVLPMFSSIPLR